jgi:hypothetical protein
MTEAPYFARRPSVVLGIHRLVSIGLALSILDLSGYATLGCTEVYPSVSFSSQALNARSPWFNKFAGSSHPEPRYRAAQIALSLNSEELPGEAEFRPSAEELGSKIFAVHATRHLPPNGRLVAGAAGSIDPTNTVEPPMFRPTLHFYLGELVQPHGIHSWAGHPIAILTPLGDLKPQLVNISPSDTFIAGDFALTARSILIVPEGTEVPAADRHFKVRFYDPSAGLRRAVDDAIRNEGGWAIRTEPGDISLGDKAIYDTHDLNNPAVFEALLRESPHVSFGDHISSVRGEAFRYGIIDRALTWLFHGIADPNWETVSTRGREFLRALALHNIERLERTVATYPFTAEAKRVVEDKIENARQWLSLIDVDFVLRKRHSRTLVGAPEEILEKARSLRGSVQLLSYVESVADELPKMGDQHELDEASRASMLAPMSSDEVDGFVSSHPSIVQHLNIDKLRGLHAIYRWLLVGSHQAINESLPRRLATSLRSLSKDKEIVPELIDAMKTSLALTSNRLPVALDILQLPALQTFLRSTGSIRFPTDGPKTLEDVLRALPETRDSFSGSPWDTLRRHTIFYFLWDIGFIGRRPRDRTRDPLEIQKSFSEARSYAADMRALYDKAVSAISDADKPMSSARAAEAIVPGRVLSLYERLRRDHQPIEMWTSVGLGDEYREMFPDDLGFWTSQKSLSTIYRELLERKAASGGTATPFGKKKPLGSDNGKEPSPRRWRAQAVAEETVAQNNAQDLSGDPNFYSAGSLLLGALVILISVSAGLGFSPKGEAYKTLRTSIGVATQVVLGLWVYLQFIFPIVPYDLRLWVPLVLVSASVVQIPLHELGHYFVALIIGLPVELHLTHVRVNPSEKRDHLTVLETICFLTAGSLTQFMIAAVLWPMQNVLVHSIAIFTVANGLANWLPVYQGNAAVDGMRIYQALWWKWAEHKARQDKGSSEGSDEHNMEVRKEVGEEVSDPSQEEAPNVSRYTDSAEQQQEIKSGQPPIGIWMLPLIVPSLVGYFWGPVAQGISAAVLGLGALGVLVYLVRASAAFQNDVQKRLVIFGRSVRPISAAFAAAA